jgi:S-formylglutathione hydrolase FrmB
MALAEISFFGKSLGMNTRLMALLPESTGTGGRFPVFYLLHGLGDDCTAWVRKTGIERYVSELPLIVVMPDAGRGWYTNARAGDGRAYEDHLVKDLVPFVDRVFPTIARREGRVIGGLSMGGYGAVKMALKFPEMFCSATSHSGSVMTPLHKPETRPKDLQALKPEFEAIFGQDWRGGENDPLALAKKCPITLRPALRLDCGLEDFLLDQNREFHAYLESIRFPHEYAEFPGDHAWAYWDEHVKEAIAFHGRRLHLSTGG